MKSSELLPYVNNLAATTSNVSHSFTADEVEKSAPFFWNIFSLNFFCDHKNMMKCGRKEIAIIRRFIAFFCLWIGIFLPCTNKRIMLKRPTTWLFPFYERSVGNDSNIDKKKVHLDAQLLQNAFDCSALRYLRVSQLNEIAKGEREAKVRCGILPWKMCFLNIRHLCRSNYMKAIQDHSRQSH